MFYNNAELISQKVYNNKKIVMVQDMDLASYRSITNDVENVANHFQVEIVIYLDSDNEWTYWSEAQGFQNLNMASTMEEAFEIAKERYLS